MRNLTITSFLVILGTTFLLLIPSCKGSQSNLIDNWESEKDRLISEASGKTVAELVEQLESPEAGERVAAMMVIEEMGPENAFYDLLDLKSESVSNLWDEWSVIIKKWGERVTPYLLEELENTLFSSNTDDDFVVYRNWALLEGLEAVGPDAVDAVPMLVQVLNREDIRQFYFVSICRSLEDIGYSSDEIIDALLFSLDDETFRGYHGDVCYALGKLASPGDERVITRLIEFVEYYESDPYFILWHLVLPARYALYKLEYEQEENYRTITEFASCSNDPNCSNGYTAWQVLARIGDDEAIQTLGELIMLSEIVDLILAVQELGRIGPKPEVIEYLIQALNRSPYTWSYEEETYPVDNRPHVAETLGELGADARVAIPALIDCYEEYKIDGQEAWMDQALSMIEEAIIRIHEGI